MKIAIPTDDRVKIAIRTGRAAEFAIYQIDNEVIQNISYVKNTHENQDHEDHHSAHSHHHEHSHKELTGQLVGIDIILVNHLGKYFKENLVAAGIPYKIVKGDNIEEIIAQYTRKLN